MDRNSQKLVEIKPLVSNPARRRREIDEGGWGAWGEEGWGWLWVLSVAREDNFSLLADVHFVEASIKIYCFLHPSMCPLIFIFSRFRYVYNKPVDGYIRVDMKVVRGTKMITFSTNEMLVSLRAKWCGLCVPARVSVRVSHENDKRPRSH